MTHFLNMPLISDEPYKLSMTTEAYALYAVFMNTLEEAMREGNELENMRDWAGKKGTLARIVGLLHCATYPMPQHEQIQANTVQNACAVMSCLVEHAKHAYGLMSDSEEVQTAKKILIWLNNTRKQSFSARDCYQAIRGRVKKQEEANIALNLLEEHSYIRKIPLEKGIGRPSIKYEVNPNFGRY